MSPLGKRIIVLSMLWVFLVMVFIQVYDNVAGKDAPRPRSTPIATTGPDPVLARLAELQSCVAANPNDLDCNLETANIYFDNGQWPQAQSAYERVLELDPHNSGVMVKLAGTLIYQDDFGRAIPVLEQAARLQPESAEIQLLLGLAFSRGEPPRKAEAIAAWQRVQLLAPGTDLAQQAADLIAAETKE